ncbi:hypothetical protein [Turneriella parva]|uniref:Uncharacterized protein n=1 Tax=Turneriella parva (strain ATCC BAA-1111 / DSM 21527 / NCTC 11395 / H) TaxID=869212 RepID=I4BAC2_TURPD|nr:hypothetical protein [Turneriella parva]AFM14229.1 hypothetical protein Turpa_3595 [Turneriella parva DSM 21527]
MAEKTLDLTLLSKGLPSLTPVMGQMLLEACSICLHAHNHANPAVLTVYGDIGDSYSVGYLRVTQQMQRTYADQDRATESAAEAVAIALITQETDYTVIERSMKKTGIDYWLGKKEDAKLPLFQNKARLEISGIFKGDRSKVDGRVKTKIAQVQQSANTGLPAYIVVTEFSSPISQVKANG